MASFPYFNASNMYKTGSVKIWKTRRTISVDIRIFFYSVCRCQPVPTSRRSARRKRSTRRAASPRPSWWRMRSTAGCGWAGACATTTVTWAAAMTRVWSRGLRCWRHVGGGPALLGPTQLRAGDTGRVVQRRDAALSAGSQALPRSRLPLRHRCVVDWLRPSFTSHSTQSR